MGKETGISWTHATFNPWHGCTKVSAGCTNCYAETLSRRWGRDIWGPKAERKFFGEKHWAEPLKWNQEAEQSGERRRVFCASMADVFEQHMIPNVNSQMNLERSRLWELIEKTPMLDWLLLTKRPEQVRWMVPVQWWIHGLPTNVWIGTSCENQEQADKRIPELLQVPAAVRFLSCEPLLGPVDLEPYLIKRQIDRPITGRLMPRLSDPLFERDERVIHWCIAGGESGPHARPMHPNWARSLRDQCQAAGVAFHFKQWGEYIARDQVADFGDDIKDIERFGWSLRPEWREQVIGKPWGCLYIDGQYLPETTTWNGREGDPRDSYEVTVHRVGKKAAGRLLDGRTHDDFPDAPHVIR